MKLRIYKTLVLNKDIISLNKIKSLKKYSVSSSLLPPIQFYLFTSLMFHKALVLGNTKLFIQIVVYNF